MLLYFSRTPQVQERIRGAENPERVSQVPNNVVKLKLQNVATLCSNLNAVENLLGAHHHSPIQ